MPDTEAEWLRISEKFGSRWNFDHCCGSLDGKHIVIRPPANCGSAYYNYKLTNSIVLLALVDADYKFIYVDVGTNGRISDGGVFAKSTLSTDLHDNSLHLPPARPLPGRTKPQPYVIVADEAFPLQPYLMKPFSSKNTTTYERRIYNYRLSRARRIVENAFGILANRFRVFLHIIPLDPDKVERIVLAACCLHNFLREHDSAQNNDGLLDSEDTSTGRLTEGTWRTESAFHTWHHLARNVQNRSTNYATEVRQEFVEYFTNEGTVPWQDQSVQEY